MWSHTDSCRLRALLASILLGIPLQAAADRLRVGDLVFDYAPPWQRAGADEEAQAEGFILRLGEGLLVLLPRHQAVLKLPETRFYEQLEMRWRAQYGEDLSLEWFDAAGRRWRVARRPSVERTDAVVFHLVTVLEGRAHHLLAYAPDSARTLPAEVRALLAGTPSAIERWILERVVRELPRGAALEGLAELEAHGLGGQGGVTGYAAEARAHGLAGFLEGFRWVKGPDGRDRRQPLLRRWEIGWSEPGQSLTGGGTLALEVSSGPADAGPAPAVRVHTGLLCGPREALTETLGRLERGEAGARLRFEALAAACGVAAGSLPQGEAQGGPAQTVRLSLPARIAPAADARPDGGARRLVVSVRPLVSAGGAWGEHLLGAMAVHYIYAPEAQE